MAIKKTVQSIQHLRNSGLTASKEAAIAALSADTLVARDGEIILNRYTEGNKTKTIFAINYVSGNTTEATGHDVTIFDFDKDALDALDARVVALSGTNESTSADTSVAGAKAYTDDVVAGLNYTDAAVEGEYVSQVTETNGVIAVTRAELPTVAAISEAGKPITAVSETKGAVSATAGTINAEYVNVADSASAFTGTTVEAVLKELDDKIEAAKSATTVASADGSINVTTGASGTDINVNIKTGEHVLAKDGNAGLYTDIKLSGVTPSSTTVKEEYALIATDGSSLGETIKIYKDSSLVSITYITDPADPHYQNLEYVYIDASGATHTEYVDMSSLVLEAEFASGVTATNHVVHGVVDPTSEAFLTVGADGFKLAGVQSAITSAIEALDVTGDTAVAGQYVAAIEETDGLVAVKTRANVSEAVLNNYSKGSDTGAVASTDTVNEAISKLENQIDNIGSAATTVVAEGTDAGNNMSIVETAGADGHKIFTINLSDVASDAALDALSAKTVTAVAMTGGTASTAATADGTLQINIDTDGSQIDLTNYSKGSDSGDVASTDTVNAAISKLENKIDAVNDVVEGLDYTDTAQTGYYVSKVDEADGVISVTREALPTVAAITEAGKPIVAVAENLGEISASAGTIDAQYVNVADAGGLFTATTVEAVLAEIDAAYKAGDEAIVDNASESANTLAKLEEIVNELSSDAKEYHIVKTTTDLPETVKERYSLVDAAGNVSGDTIDVPKDSHIVSITYDGTTQKLTYTYIDVSGNTQSTDVDMSELVLETEFASGVTVTDHIAHGVVDPTSENFLTVGANGFKLAGVQNAIDDSIATAISGLDATVGSQTVAADKHVAVEVVEVDGKLTGLTVTESDIASASALTAEIAARKAVDGVNGDAYSANTNAHYISGSNDLFDADQDLDAALYELSGKVESSDIVAGNGIQVSPSGNDDTEVAVKLGGEPTGLTSALEATSDGLHFTGWLDAGTY